MTEDEAKQKWPIVGYKGRRVGHSKGYIRVKSPNHPNAGSDGYVYEHVYVASVLLGRAIRSDEDVHHVDDNPSNNVRENLQVLSKKAHRRLHASKRGSRSTRPKCAVCNLRIAYGATFCADHYWAAIRASDQKCRVADCSATAGHRSGLCREHVRYRSNKRRYNAEWDFHHG